MLCLSPKSAGFPVHGLTLSNHPRRHTLDLLSRRCFPRPVLLDLIPRSTVIRTQQFLLGRPSPYQSPTSSSVTSKNKSWSWLSRRKTSFTREVQVCRRYPVYFHRQSFCLAITRFVSVGGKQVAAIDIGVALSLTSWANLSLGTGKSVLLREIIKTLRKEYVRTPDAVAVTASTGD